MDFASRGVLALVRLHETEMRRFLEVWREAYQAEIVLPASEDPDYAGLTHLLRHILRASRGYLTWVCSVLGRPDPGVPDPPPVEHVTGEGEAFLSLLLASWREHLAWIPNEVVDSNEGFAARWGGTMTIEGMLEHAVVHPMRHSLQLQDLLQAGKAS